MYFYQSTNWLINPKPPNLTLFNLQLILNDFHKFIKSSIVAIIFDDR